MELNNEATEATGVPYDLIKKSVSPSSFDNSTTSYPPIPDAE